MNDFVGKAIDYLIDLMSFLILVLLITICGMSIDAHADTIKGETALGGMSKVMSDFYDRGGQLINEEDLSLLAEVMYHENYCNGDYIMLLTGSVVLNRVESKHYPNTIKGVLYDKGQYSTVKKFYSKEIPSHVYLLAKKLLIGGSICPKSTVFQATFPQGSGIYDKEHTVDVCGEYFCFW